MEFFSTKKKPNAKPFGLSNKKETGKYTKLHVYLNYIIRIIYFKIIFLNMFKVTEIW